MSLVYFNGLNSDTETIALIKEKTGLELNYVGGGDYNIYECQVKFPDMVDYETLYMEKPSVLEPGLCFVDVENHFFAWVKPQTDMNEYRPSNTLKVWLCILIHEKDGKLVSDISSTDRYSMYNWCNIPDTVENIIKGQITLVPLYAKDGKSFVKNTYINYERMFQPGLKFVDQNNNEFITLGGYLLYYNGKHK